MVAELLLRGIDGPLRVRLLVLLLLQHLRHERPSSGVWCTDWVGLGWVGLGWAGLGWAGLGWVGSGRVGSGWGIFCCTKEVYRQPPT